MEETIVKQLKQACIGIIPTDTLYGIVGSALSSLAVERIYKIKKRDLDKPFIILIADLTDLDLFDINLDQNIKNYLIKIWPGPFSVVIPCKSNQFTYLHRGTNSLAFRIPNDNKLLSLLKQTGPLVAPSANVQNFPPAQAIDQAKKYFSNQVDFYQDGGRLSGSPSTIIKIEDKNVIIIRQGDAMLPAFIP